MGARARAGAGAEAGERRLPRHAVGAGGLPECAGAAGRPHPRVGPQRRVRGEPVSRGRTRDAGGGLLQRRRGVPRGVPSGGRAQNVPERPRGRREVHDRGQGSRRAAGPRRALRGGHHRRGVPELSQHAAGAVLQPPLHRPIPGVAAGALPVARRAQRPVGHKLQGVGGGARGKDRGDPRAGELRPLRGLPHLHDRRVGGRLQDDHRRVP